MQDAASEPKTRRARPLVTAAIAAVVGAVAAGVLGVSTTRDFFAPPATASDVAAVAPLAADSPFAAPVDVAPMSAEEAAGYVEAIGAVDRAFARARALSDEKVARLRRLSRNSDAVFNVAAP